MHSYFTRLPFVYDIITTIDYSVASTHSLSPFPLLIILEDYYEILDLKQGLEATVDDVKKAYRKLLIYFHPDKMKGSNEEISGMLSVSCIYILYGYVFI